MRDTPAPHRTTASYHTTPPRDAKLTNDFPRDSDGSGRGGAVVSAPGPQQREQEEMGRVRAAGPAAADPGLHPGLRVVRGAAQRDAGAAVHRRAAAAAEAGPGPRRPRRAAGLAAAAGALRLLAAPHSRLRLRSPAVPGLLRRSYRRCYDVRGVDYVPLPRRGF